MPDFNLAVKTVLRDEGGYSNDPTDPGGETKFGISKRSYPNLDIKNLTVEQAIEIYKNDFWHKNHYDLIDDQVLATKVFTLAVTNPKAAHKALQLSILRLGGFVLVDGVLGPKTLFEINAQDPVELLDAFKHEMIKFYISLHKPKYLKGWINRVDADVVR